MAYRITTLPWHTASWEQFSRYQQQLPHALLLSGRAGWGIEQFARRASQLLLCEQSQACGTCQQCQLIATQQHPDFYYLSPEEEGKSIKVDAVRDLIDTIVQSPQVAAAKVILINTAESLTLGAANALLKILEEPVKNVFFLLCTEQISLTLPTIRSRCQIISFTEPAYDTALAWLAAKENADIWLRLTQSAPLIAEKYLAEPEWTVLYHEALKTFITFATEFNLIETSQKLTELSNKIPLLTLLEWFKYYCRDVIATSMAALEKAELIHQTYAFSIQQMAEKYNSTYWWHAYFSIMNKQTRYTKQNTLNVLLLWDSLLQELMYAR